MQLTDEQKAILACSGNTKIHAVAGSGKTSTLVEYARVHGKNRRILYLAFNRSVKLEAQRRFESANIPNVRVETAHSLAWKQIVPQAGYKVRMSYKPWEIAELLHLRPLGKDPLSAIIIAGHINRFASLFCNQPHAKVQDINYLDWVQDSNARTFVKKVHGRIIDGTRKLLALMNCGKIEITHEFYLKKFQLTSPRLSYDLILFDEGQDASPVMLDIFLHQDHALKLIVGDVHQQIYAWRYAVNALSNVDFSDFSLTASFRFPQGIADLAMAALQWKIHLNDPVDVMITGLGKKVKSEKSRATLARTNLSLLRRAIDFTCSGSGRKKIYFEGNLSSYTYASEGASLWDVLNLFTRKRGLIRDPLITKMKSFVDLQEYADLSEDTELLTLIDMVEEYGNDLPFFMKNLRESHLEDGKRERADMIFSTVHRCKGLEYDAVSLDEDFITEKKLIRLTEENELSPTEIDRLNEEINLLYVAITRSRGKLTIPDSLFGKSSPYCEQTKGTPQNRGKTKKAGQFFKTNTPKSYASWTQQDDDRLRLLVTRGSPAQKIAQELDRTMGAISSRIKKLGINR